MVTAALYGVVPSLDDLQWRWELPDGVPLQDLLLCSVPPTLRRPSAVFVETNANANTRYKTQQNLIADSSMPWYPAVPVTHQLEVPQPMPTLNSTVLAPNLVSTGTVVSMETFDAGYGSYHHESFEPSGQGANVNVNFGNVGNPTATYAVKPTIKSQQQEYNMPLTEMYHKFSGSYGETTEIDPTELEHAQSTIGSVHSTSSWDSFNDDSSRTTEQSQEEILEEIMRECAELERSSASPTSPSMKTPRDRKSVRSNRHIDDNDRKKELNRVAAAKYREKKRIEREYKLTELTSLEKRNQKLKSQHDKYENEIKYLKELIKEIRSRRSSP